MGRAGFSMDPEFVAAVAQVAAGEQVNISRFCREHGVSRGVFHKYVTRFRVEGADGFTRRSTAPHHRPGALGATVAEAVLRARKELADEGRDNGPISIRWRLEDTGLTRCLRRPRSTGSCVNEARSSRSHARSPG